MSKQSVRDYYAKFDTREWDRLTWPEGQIEYRITVDAFRRHLPLTGRVLDIGGGVGRWTIWMAANGYRVTLADLSPNLLDIAKNKIHENNVQTAVEEVVVVDVCDLSRWSNNSFDVVLCLGPFYHLTDPTDRERAAQEIHRVVKNGGLVFVAFMPVYGFLRRTLALQDEQHHLTDKSFMTQLLKNGIFTNEIEGRFNSGYGVRPQEIEPFLQAYGFEMQELLSDCGFAGSNASQLAELAKTNLDAYEAIMDVIIGSADDPSLHGSAVHLLYIGKKC